MSLNIKELYYMKEKSQKNAGEFKFKAAYRTKKKDRILLGAFMGISLVFMLLSEFSFTACPIGRKEIIKGESLSVGNAGKSGKKAEDSLSLYALSAALIDGENNRLLYGKKPDKRLPMASTTKIMTLIVILEEADLKDIVTFSKYAASMPDVQLNAREGDQFIMEDLCYALMLESYNDVAAALAEHVGGSKEGFAELMNKKAEELGLKNTHFVTSNGLDSEGHYTTARDLAHLASYAIKNQRFIEITNTKSHSFSEVNGKGNYTVHNKNAFLNMYPGAIGIKTGFTGKAGYCFAGAVKQEDRVLVSVVLASGWPPSKTRKWQDTKALMDYGTNNYKKKTVGIKNPHLPEIRVEDGKKENVEIATDALPVSLLLKDSEEVSVDFRIMREVKAPVEKGKTVGRIRYLLGDEVLAYYSIYTKEGVEKQDMGFWIGKVLGWFML